METRTYEEIQLRISEVKSQLTIIDQEMDKERSKLFLDRCRFRVQLLDLNKKLYTEALKQLNWVLHA
jgi:hypothetical protein